jgi:hypothetical protein
MYVFYLPPPDNFPTTATQRGEHNIETAFVYPTAKGFIFHDSRGFEAGSNDELKKVREFIAKRAEAKQMEDQLHAIWYFLGLVQLC